MKSLIQNQPIQTIKDRASFSTQQEDQDQREQTNFQLTFAIDNLTFCIQGRSSQKNQIENKKKQMIELYNQEYMKRFQYYQGEELMFQFIQPQDYKYVQKSNQQTFLRFLSYKDALSLGVSPILGKRLKHIILQKDKIYSIQNLSLVDFPHLKLMYLNQTKIRNINCLSRASMCQLQWIALQNTPIVNFNKFNRGNFKKLKKFSFDNEDSYQYVGQRIEDLTFLFKTLNFKNIVAIRTDDQSSRIQMNPYMEYILNHARKSSYRKSFCFRQSKRNNPEIENFKKQL